MRQSIPLLFLLVVLSFSVGCASLQPAVSQSDEPLYVQYDIQYVDNTKIGIDLLILADAETVPTANVEEDVYKSVMTVARDLGKSDILTRQMEFRSALQESFEQESRYANAVQIVVVDVIPGTWMAGR